MPKPNLLFIFTDEQRQDTMRAYGNARIRTPNLDALADSSVVFTSAYVSQPVCTPSRSTIMTGLYPHTNGCVRNGIPLDEAVPTIAELFTDRSYRFMYAGKWHLGDDVWAQHGFDDWISLEDEYRQHYRPHRDRSVHCTYYHWLVERGFTPDAHREGFSFFGRPALARLPAEFSRPAFLAEQTSRYIRDNRDRPWVAYVNFHEPHMPFTGPYDGLYDPGEVELPRNFDAPPHPDEPALYGFLREQYRRNGIEGLPLGDEADWRRLIANYWGLITLLDESVGDILRTLSECGLDESTIVVFTSDHGDMMGSHRLVSKGVMLEEAAKVPLLMRVPQIAGAPRRVECPISQVDLVPTLLDLMGQPIAPRLEGNSLRLMLEGDLPHTHEEGGPHGGCVFIEWDGRHGDPGSRDGRISSEVAKALAAKMRCVVSPAGWKLNLSEADKCELYHLPSDPEETTNLYYSGAHRQVIDELSNRIRRWQARTGDDAGV